MSSSPEAAARRKAERAHKVVVELNRHGGALTFTQIENALGGSASVASRYVEDARSLGLIERVGEPNQRGTFWRVVSKEEPSSSRETILKILADGPIDDDKTLMNAMGGSWRTLGMHSLDHQLFSMEKAGLIEMDVKRNGSVQSITNIRLPKPRIRKSEVLLTVRQEDLDDGPALVEAYTDLVEHRFPLLDSLRAQEQARSDTNRRVDALLSAASALDGVEQGESDRLMALAESIAQGSTLSDVETEYLRFAAWKEGQGE